MLQNILGLHAYCSVDGNKFCSTLRFHAVIELLQ